MLGMPRMIRGLGVLAVLIFVLGLVFVTGCINTGNQPSNDNLINNNTVNSSIPSSQNSSTPSPHVQPSTPKTWGMKEVWNISTVGIPFMDLRPDGGLAAVIDHNNAILYLIKPDGSSVSFNTQEDDDVQPVISGVAIKEDTAYVLASYEGFSGIRAYTWDGGKVDEIKVGGPGSVADWMMRSPSGDHMCYLVTVSPTEQSLRCDGGEVKLTPNGYGINWVSDTGVVILSEGDKSYVFKDGNRVLTLDTPNAIAYKNRIVADKGGTLKILSLNGTVLVTRKNVGFGRTTLLRWTLIPTGKYLFRHEPLEDTHVFNWNLDEVKVLPGFPAFANENFVVTVKDGVIHAYSLSDFHEVFNTSVPGDSFGYIQLSDDGKVMLVSGDVGDFYLFKATESASSSA